MYTILIRKLFPIRTRLFSASGSSPNRVILAPPILVPHKRGVNPVSPAPVDCVGPWSPVSIHHDTSQVVFCLRQSKTQL